MVERLLIVKLSSLGDVLHTLPAGQALRAAFPAARIAWAIERAHAPLVERQPWLDETIVWERGKPGGFRRFISQLRQQRWDVAIDFQGLFRSGLVTWLSGARRRLGAQQARELAPWFYNEWVWLPSLERHAVDKALDLVRPLGAQCRDAPLDRPYLEGRPPRRPVGLGPRLFPLQPTTDDRAQVDAWCRAHDLNLQRESLVLLNPHARRAANLWPAERFAELAQRLSARPGTRVGLTAGPAARALCDGIAQRVGPGLLRADGCFSLLGAAELIRRAALLVTGDTGPMHLAAAVDTPIVALVGATSPMRTGPYTTDAIVLRRALECAPCLAKTCRLRQDPPPCMDQLEVTAVAAAVERRLDAGPTPLARSAA